MVEENYPSPDARKKVFENLLGIELKDELLSNYASLENTIRSKMLKSGGSAFVEEDQEIFIPVEDIRNLVLDGGGIPTYPFLADFGDANYTDFEADPDEAAEILIEKGFYSIEFIPGRNDFTLLKDYVLNLHKKGFLISFGTEHNAPGQAPLEVSAKAGHPLDKELMSINYEAACVFAAHQYLVWKEGEGWLDMEGRPYFERKEEFRELGDRIIRTIIK